MDIKYMLASKHQPGCPDQDQQDGREGSESRKKTVLQKTMSQSKADLQAEKGKQHGKEACQPGRELHDTGTEAGGDTVHRQDDSQAQDIPKPRRQGNCGCLIFGNDTLIQTEDAESDHDRGTDQVGIDKKIFRDQAGGIGGGEGAKSCCTADDEVLPYAKLLMARAQLDSYEQIIQIHCEPDQKSHNDIHKKDLSVSSNTFCDAQIGCILWFSIQNIQKIRSCEEKESVL